jgi:hypothetical protein
MTRIGRYLMVGVAAAALVPGSAVPALAGEGGCAEREKLWWYRAPGSGLYRHARPDGPGGALWVTAHVHLQRCRGTALARSPVR